MHQKHPSGHFIMNAAGTCKDLETVIELCKVEDLSAILLGSVTRLPRQGNSDNVYVTSAHGTLNSLGMPNQGIEKYAETLLAMMDLAHRHGKEFGVSVAAIDHVEEYGILAGMCLLKGADFVELNFGCPNVWSHGKQHRILTFDINACQGILSDIQTLLKDSSSPEQVYIKVSPISDPVYLEELASLFNEFPIVTGVTATNTFPNGHGRDASGKQLISVGSGLAGVSGAALKFISKGQVLQWRKFLNPEKEIIAAGGIDCGQDILDYGANGATRFQIGTAYLDKGPAIFGQVLADAMILIQ